MSKLKTHSFKTRKNDGAFSGKWVFRTNRNSDVSGKIPTAYFHKIRAAHWNHWFTATTLRLILYFWSHRTCGLRRSRIIKGAEKMIWAEKAAHTLQWGDMRKNWRLSYTKSQIHCSKASLPRISNTRIIILWSITYNSHAIDAAGFPDVEKCVNVPFLSCPLDGKRFHAQLYFIRNGVSNGLVNKRSWLLVSPIPPIYWDRDGNKINKSLIAASYIFYLAFQTIILYFKRFKTKDLNVFKTLAYVSHIPVTC